MMFLLKLLKNLVPLTPLIFYQDDDGAGGGGGDTWSDALPESVREWDEVTNSDSAEKFWDQMANMRSFVGQSIRIPGKDAGKEDWDKFHNKMREKVPGLMLTPNPDDEVALVSIYSAMGRPDKPEGYTVPDLPKDVELNTAPIEIFRPIAHKAGITQKQWDVIVSEMTKSNVTAYLAQKDLQDRSLGQLKSEWGVAYENNMGVVEGLLKVTDAPEVLAKHLQEGKVDIGTIKWLYGVAQKLGSEETIKAALDKNRQEGKLTPEQARVQIDEMLRNKNHPYWDKTSPAHKDAVKRMLVLQKLANPEPGLGNQERLQQIINSGL